MAEILLWSITVKLKGEDLGSDLAGQV